MTICEGASMLCISAPPSPRIREVWLITMQLLDVVCRNIFSFGQTTSQTELTKAIILTILMLYCFYTAAYAVNIL